VSIDAAIPLATYTVAGTGPYPLNWPYAGESVVAMVLVGDAWTELSAAEARLEPLSSDTGGALYLDASTAAYHAGRQLHVTRATPREQGWEGLSGTREKGLEQALDQLAMNVQDLAASVSRTLRVPASTVLSSLRDGALIMYENGRFKSGPRVADLITGGGGDTAADLTFDDFGAVGDGIHDDSDAIERGVLAGVRRLRGRRGATYLINKVKTFWGIANLVIDLSGCTIQRGPDAPGGWRFFDHYRVYVIGDRSGLWRGNRDTAGPYPGLFTTGGLKTLDGVDASGATGTAAAAYGAGSTSTINVAFAESIGWLKKGARLSFITGGQTYAHVVQADVQIVAGMATGVVLDRPVAAAIASGQNLYCKWWGRHMVVAGDRLAGSSTIVLECYGATSPDGNPRILAGDEFAFLTNYNDVLSIDYSFVGEVMYDAAFTGAAPALQVTIVLKEPLPFDVKRGTGITSLQDGRNNRHADILFYGGSNSGVIGLDFENVRFHGVAANATIRAPFAGVDPSTRPNANMTFADCSDTSSDGAGCAFVGAWTERMVVSGNTGIYALGSMRNLCGVERSSLYEVVGNYQRGGQYLCTMNGECSDGRVVLNHGKHLRRMIRQANTSTRITIAYNGGIAHSSYTDFFVMVWAGTFDQEAGEETASTARLNDTKVEGNVFSGRGRTAGGMGSHIIVGPQLLNPDADEADWPRLVWVTGNSSTDAAQHGIWCLMGVGVTLELNSILRPGIAGILMQGGRNNALLTNEIIDAGTITPSAGVVLNGGTGLRLLGNRTLVDTGTGMAKGLAVQAGAEIVDDTGNDWHGSEVSGGLQLAALRSLADLYALRNYGRTWPDGEVVQAGPLFFKGAPGATALPGLPDLLPWGYVRPEHGGTGADLASHQAAQDAAAITGAPILISQAAVMSAGVAEGSDFLLRETAGPLTWASPTDAQRAMPGLTSNAAASSFAKLFHKKTNSGDTGGLMYVSMRTMPTASLADFQTDAFQVCVVVDDPSDMNGDETAFAVRRGGVALHTRARVGASNLTGAAWSSLIQAEIDAGGDGSLSIIEGNIMNRGSDVASYGAPLQKQGIVLITKEGSGTIGFQLKNDGGDGWINGFSVRHNAMHASIDGNAFEYETFWRVDNTGAMFLGKDTGSQTEQGIELQQDGDVVLTKSAGIVALKLVRATAMGSTGGVAIIDADAQTSAGTQRNIGRQQWQLIDPTDASEDAELRTSAMVAGTLTHQMAVGNGVTIGAAGLTGPGQGNLYASGFLRCGSYTVATVPSASAAGNGAMIFVSDESGGAVTAYAHGANWRRVTDRAIIS
jgi:hypothetical protein